MRWLCLCVIASLCGSSVLGQRAGQASSLETSVDASPSFLDRYRAKAIDRWEKDVQKLESRDADQEDPADAILFIGSSSIRRWSDIAIDMAPYRPVQRGYGGSKFSDVAIFAERILHPHQYRALVVFVGNDVSGKPEDHTPAEVESLVRYLVNVSHQHQPDAPVLLIEITPTEKRFSVWSQIRQVNASIREVALSTPHTYFIATAEHFLDPMGNPRNELFVEDRLHLNGDGYDLWSGLIRQRLDEVLRTTEEFRAKGSTAVDTDSK